MLTKWLMDEERKRMQLEIPTSQVISTFPHLPNISAEKARDLGQMFQTIEERYKSNTVYFILIHKMDCPFCRQSMPYWKTITEELQRRLDHFRSDELEYDSPSRLKNGQFLTGKAVYQKVRPRGVPAVLSNVKGVRGRLKTYPEMKVVWDMVIQPFPFLREVFSLQ